MSTSDRVHFSDLKQLSRSPAHYYRSATTPRERTRPMTVGSIADDIVFHRGRHVTVFPGRARHGKDWEAFQALHGARTDRPARIMCIQSEYDDAAGSANAVLRDPVAAALLEGCEFQRVMEWDAFELKCAAGVAGVRGGVDAINVDKGYLLDLKITSDAKPETLMRHAHKMHWDAQLEWYREGVKRLGMGELRGFLVCAEATEPHPVTVLAAGADVLDFGRKKLVLWCEELRRCVDAGVWPGYAQSPVAWELDEWMREDEET